MEVVSTSKGKLCLIIDAYRYRKEKAYDNRIFWRCVSKPCKARCKTDIGIQNLLAGHNTTHNHEPLTPAKLDLERARTSVKREAEEAPEQMPKKSVCQETVKYETLSDGDVSSLTQVSTIPIFIYKPV